MDNKKEDYIKSLAKVLISQQKDIKVLSENMKRLMDGIAKTLPSQDQNKNG